MQARPQSKNETHTPTHETKCQTIRCHGEEDVSWAVIQRGNEVWTEKSPRIPNKTEEQTFKEITQQSQTSDLQHLYHGRPSENVPRRSHGAPRLGHGIADIAVKAYGRLYLRQPSRSWGGARPVLGCVPIVIGFCGRRPCQVSRDYAPDLRGV